MTRYVPLGKRKTFKSGTSIVLTIPEAFVKKNNIKVGDHLEVQWDGYADLRLRVAKK